MVEKSFENNQDNPFVIGFGRDSNWAVYIPGLLRGTKFTQHLVKVIPYVMDEVHPFLSHSDVVLTFPENIEKVVDGEKIYISGNTHFEQLKNKRLQTEIQVSQKKIRELSEKYSSPISWWAISSILHELFEVNYWLEGIRLKDIIPQSKLNDSNYREAEHEVIADGRTRRIMQIAFNAKIVESPDGFFTTILPEEYQD